LLDSVQRRVQRMLMPPVEETRVKKMILDRYPKSNIEISYE
jgi:hypothetical protein